MVQCYGDLPDIVTFEEEASPCFVVCTAVHYYTFWGAEPAHHLLVKEVGYLLQCVLL